MTETRKPENLIELLRQLKADGVPENEHYTRVQQFLEFKARDKGVPMNGHFELTPLCNLDCRMCYVHLCPEQYSGSDLLPVDTWKSLVLSARKAGMLSASLTGGECLTYPGFDALYLYLYEMGVRTHVLTNGLLLDAERIAFFKRYPAEKIQVSLYGSSDDAYERVTGKRAFTAVYQNVCRARDEKLPISIAITPNRFMVDDMDDLLKTAQELQIPYNINSNLIPPRPETGRKTEDMTIAQYVEIFKKRKQLNQEELTPLDAMELPDESRTGEQQYGVLCGAGRSSFGIRYDGAMCPCLSLGETVEYPLEVGFEEAWKRINARANQYPMPRECGDCLYRSVCMHCPAMHKSAPVGHCDTRICERTKELIMAGFIPMPKQE